MNPWPTSIRSRINKTSGRLLPALTLVVLVAALAVLMLFHPSPRTRVTGSVTDSNLLELSGATMGTQYRVLIHTDALAPTIREQLRLDVSDRLAYLDRHLMSTYAADSQLSRVNRQPPGHPMLVATELMVVLTAAGQVHTLSGGAFDISVKPLVDLWGFGAGQSVQSVPDQSDIDAALARLGMDRLELNQFAGTLTRKADVTLDLSAIAKGFAVDELARLLGNRQVENFLVEIGGEVRIRGARPGGLPWQVGIETPVAAEPVLYQPLQTGNRTLAIAASGNYRNYFMHEGIRYSHTIDPQTGWPVSHDLASVTVIAESAMLADAWATALSVLGPERGMKLANELQLAAYFIVVGSKGFNAHHSAAFNQYL